MNNRWPVQTAKRGSAKCWKTAASSQAEPEGTTPRAGTPHRIAGTAPPTSFDPPDIAADPRLHPYLTTARSNQMSSMGSKPFLSVVKRVAFARWAVAAIHRSFLPIVREGFTGGFATGPCLLLLGPRIHVGVRPEQILRGDRDRLNRIEHAPHPLALRISPTPLAGKGQEFAVAHDGREANCLGFSHARCVQCRPGAIEDQPQQDAGVQDEPRHESVEIGNELRQGLGSRPLFLESGQGVGAAE